MSNAALLANLRVSKRLAMADYQKQVAQQGGAGSAGYEACGPPSWDRNAWEAFRVQYGRYPFGPQPEGGFIQPPSFNGAPSWVYELMGLRQPPVTFSPENA